MSIAAIIATLRKRATSGIGPQSIEAAAEKRKNLGFLKVNLVQDPRHGLDVSHHSLGDGTAISDNDSALKEETIIRTWKLSSTGEWLPRGLIATREFLYVLSIHNSDGLPISSPESAQSAGDLSSATLVSRKIYLYGVVDKIPLHFVASVEAVRPDSETTNGACFADVCISQSSADRITPATFPLRNIEGKTDTSTTLIDDLKRYLHQPRGGTNSIESMVHNSPQLKAAFRLVVRNVVEETSACAKAAAWCNSAVSEPQLRPRRERVIYFSTGTGGGATVARDEWVRILSDTAKTALASFRLRQYIEAVQAVLHWAYSSMLFQSAMVLAIIANFAVSIAQVLSRELCSPSARKALR